jgi:hypothetical protein
MKKGKANMYFSSSPRSSGFGPSLNTDYAELIAFFDSLQSEMNEQKTLRSAFATQISEENF